MPVDYARIRAENKQEYGNIARWGKGLLEGQYAERTHFIYEIAQNADDALASRSGGLSDRTLTFSLAENALSITHFGRPFTDGDVRGVCGIDQSTKDLTDIGRFGIGFKSVYAYTSRPEVHSGEEHFAVETYVFPQQIAARKTSPDQTLIYFSFREDVPEATIQIGSALKELDPLTLLFLRHIAEISWEVPDGTSGWIHRSDSALNGLDIRTISKGGADSSEIVEQFVVSGRDVFHEGRPAGRVEIAFRQDHDTQGNGDTTIHRAQVSKLAAFFPTEIDTHLGFLVQGPYRTTPARDNIPFGDQWNQYLVRATADLAVEALKQIRDAGLLDLDALGCFVPTSETERDGRFAPIHRAIREALTNQALIPTDTGHVTGRDAAVGNPPAVKELLGKGRLRQLLGGDRTTNWVVDEVTSERRRDLLEYLKGEASVREITPGYLMRSLTQGFLEQQPDSWIQRLYGFLGERPGLMSLAKQAPIIRLDNGTHVRPFDDRGNPLAFLPGRAATAYPTVRASVAKSKSAREFLQAMGLRELDIVDDVVDNIFPKYQRPAPRLRVKEYQQDIERIASAFSSASKAQEARLIKAAQGLKLVYAVDCGTGERSYVQSNCAYLPTVSLKSLFEGVGGILMVDDSKRFLRDDAITQLLRAIGASDIFVREPCETELSEREKREIRTNTYPYDPERTLGHEESVDDFTLQGLDVVLNRITSAPPTDAVVLAELLWDELRAFADKNPNPAVYRGTYKWYRYTHRQQQFPAAFVKALNQTAWVPNAVGQLCLPEDVLFSITSWQDDDRLNEEIEFAPEPEPTHDQPEEISEEVLLRRELIESGRSEEEAEEFIERTTTEALRRKRLLLQSESQTIPMDGDDGFSEETSGPLVERAASGGMGSSQRPVTVQVPPRPPSSGGGTSRNLGAETTGRPLPEPPVRVELAEIDDNSEGLSHEQRLALEQAAIAKILAQEPALERTPENNPGYDLYSLGEDGTPNKVVEVKSMSGSLNDRPATMSRVQFATAQDFQDKYWLYVVEHAGDPGQSHIRKIQNPAGRVQTFTFSRSWFSDDSTPT